MSIQFLKYSLNIIWTFSTPKISKIFMATNSKTTGIFEALNSATDSVIEKISPPVKRPPKRSKPHDPFCDSPNHRQKSQEMVNFSIKVGKYLRRYEGIYLNDEGEYVVTINYIIRCDCRYTTSGWTDVLIVLPKNKKLLSEWTRISGGTTSVTVPNVKMQKIILEEITHCGLHKLLKSGWTEEYLDDYCYDEDDYEDTNRW